MKHRGGRQSKKLHMSGLGHFLETDNVGSVEIQSFKDACRAYNCYGPDTFLRIRRCMVHL